MNKRILLASATLLSACSARESLAPLGPTDAASEVRPDTLAPPDAATDASTTISSTDARVTVQHDPFALVIENGKGRQLLDTRIASPPKDDSLLAYGPLGATHRSMRIKPTFIVGWDHLGVTDSPFRQASRVTSVTAGATDARFELASADGTATYSLEVALQGAEVSLSARVLSFPTAPNEDEEDVSPPGANLLGMAFALPVDEQFFGLGERFVTVNQRGQRIENWVEEGGLGAGEGKGAGMPNPAPNGAAMTHAPIPFLLSSKGYGMWLDTTYRTGFVLGADTPDAFRIYAVEPSLKLKLFVHDDPAETLRVFTEKTGRATLPAPWVFGPRRRSGAGAQARGMPEYLALRKFRVPTTAIDDAAHFLPIGSHKGNEARMLDWTSKLHENGFKAVTYFNCYVSVTDARMKDEVEEARKNGYFVKLDDGTEHNMFMISGGPQTVAAIDMSNPDAVKFFERRLQAAIDLQYDGFMLDFGEYIPYRAKLFDGRSGWEAHNDFPVMYQKATTEYMRSKKGNDWMYFARAGYTGTAKWAPVLWSGDPSASFDDVKGLPSSVRAGVSAGMSGIPIWGSDISGYTCLNDPPADKEVYLRWVQFGALSPEMHEEDACAQKPAGAPDKWTLWSDDETIRVYGDYSRLHTRLFPYIYAAAKVSVDTGLPIMRHPFLVHPEQTAGHSVDLEYYFGSALYVAPVVRRGATTRTFWLPPGEWVDFWTFEPIAGGQVITRDAPLSVLPLYQRSGELIAMLDESVETLASRTAPDVVSMADVEHLMDVRAVLSARSPSARATLVDGTTFEVTLAAAPATTTGASEAELATCSACSRSDVLVRATRTRYRSSPKGTDDTTVGHVRAQYKGRERQIRWDVVVLD